MATGLSVATRTENGRADDYSSTSRNSNPLPPSTRLGVWALDGVVVMEEASRAPRALAYGIVLFQSDPPDPMTNPPVEVELL